LAEARKGTKKFEWDVYFFIPENLRIHERTYAKSAIYEDLQSYVRYAVPRAALDEILGAPLDRLRRSLTEGSGAARELRLFACLVRGAGVRADHAITELLDQSDADTAHVSETALRLVQTCRLLSTEFRNALRAMPKDVAQRDRTLVETAELVDEDVSRVIETLLASLAIELRRRQSTRKAASAVASAAVEQARYRKEAGLGGVGHAGASKREVEHLEFRRHVLKRFTSSVLWLSMEVRQAATMVKQGFYALAAAAAMAFAVAAALWTGADPYGSGNLWAWVAAVVLAYAGKDRLKALLQARFKRLLAKRFPDRRWHIRDRERNVEVGRVQERAAFVDEGDLPAEVYEARIPDPRPVHYDARPERILWHQKTVTFRPERVKTADDRFDAITEIFRLNVSRWLEHTDDPKRKIVFADPEDWHVYSAVAPRVYNISVVYRLRTPEHQEAEWRRLRVVVTRKGIQRLDEVS